MRYNPLLRRKGRAARRGIAVMYALGILSLVIIAVLIFSRRAVVDRKVASSYANYTGAKDLAQSALGRAVLQLQKNASLSTSFYSGRAGDNDFDWLWKLDPAKRFLPTGKAAPVRWQYVYGPDGHIIGRYAYVVMGGDRLKLNAILDHRFCKDGETCNGISGCPRNEHRGNSATELNFYSAGTHFPKFSSYLKLKEAPEGGSTTFAVTNLHKITSNNEVVMYQSAEQLFYRYLVPNGSSVANGRVMHTLNSALNISFSSALDEPDAWFVGDLNGDKVKNKSEFYQRFLLRQTDWGAIADKTGNGDAAVNCILNDAAPFYDANGKPVTTNTTGIPWLKNWSESSGNWPNPATKAKQIAANLINYCAPEAKPVVSDVNPENWYGETSVSAPSYTGNKRTWYLNECGVILEIEVDLGNWTEHGDGSAEAPYWYSFGDGGSGKKIKITYRLHLLPEIINMYGATASGVKLPGAASTYRIVAFADMQFKHTQGMSYNADGSNNAGTYATSNLIKYACMGSSLFNINGVKPSTDADKVKCQSTGIVKSGSVETYQKFAFGKTGVYYIDGSFEIAGSFASSSKTPSNDELNALFKVKDITINNLSLFLKTECLGSTDKLRYVDCSFLPAITVTGEQSLPATASTTPAVSKYYSVNDPRHNLHADDWAEKTSDTLGSVNEGITCNAGTLDPAKTSGWDQDPETSTDPVNGSISTAYIRHGTMRMLWELGAIHRAAPWQTLNFKRPKLSSATDAQRLAENLKTKGGGAYSEGDFRILDQVTMQGGTTYVPAAQFGWINLNVPYSGSRTFAFSSMFKNMYWSTAGNYTKIYTSTGTILLKDHTDGIHARILAEKLGSVPDDVRLFNRSDIFFAPKDAAFWDLIEKEPVAAADAEGTPLTTDAQQEQLIGRFIGLTTANTMPDSATVIVLAQTIRDVGGITVYRDWGDNGAFATTTLSVSTSYPKLQKAGLAAGYYYRATNSNTVANPGFFPTPTSLSDVIETKFGRYENGADQITGETKLMAMLQYDQTEGKWKIVQVKYED